MLNIFYSKKAIAIKNFKNGNNGYLNFGLCNINDNNIIELTNDMLNRKLNNNVKELWFVWFDFF